MTSSVRAVAFAVLLLAACRDASNPLQPGSTASPDHVLSSASSNIIPGQYIVVFKDGVTDPDGLAQSLVSLYGGTLKHTYKSGLKGFAAILSDAAVAALQVQTALVDYIEPDQKGGPDAGTKPTSQTEQMDANGDPWGLDRIDQRAMPLSGTYTYTSTGAGVHVYLIDTGIWTLHPEFEGRADNVYDVADPTGALGSASGQDCFGHGTAVAGVVGAATYGVAKGVSLHGVRVFPNCDGQTTTSNYIAGIDWVIAHHQSPAVANIPLAADPSAAVSTEIKHLWNSGVFVAVTAGNHSADACLEQSGTSGAFVVAASTKTDARADFSNYGACVNVYAPGANIKSTWPPALPGTWFAVPHGDMTATVIGTSFAAPHVTGVAALYKATFGDAPSDVVAAWIINKATAGVITGNPVGTPNLLVYKSTL